MLHGTRCKYRSRQKSPSGHQRTTFSGYIFATTARIDNRKKLVKQQYLLHMSPQHGELRPTRGWYPSGSLEHPCKFQRVWRLGSVTARHSSWALAKLCGVYQRAPSIFGRAAITLGIGPHSSFKLFCCEVSSARVWQAVFTILLQISAILWNIGPIFKLIQISVFYLRYL